ncbi:ribosomal protein S18 acetylase RimI-like enzyme [Nocardioides ginsengisegetis]|uniref:Ribosomal protein S18 acetylase RimI-like enzyme n=1 Tax=Nocardioides ginsengisegetis TaxID=661491 RepID=A0A7W3P9M8_9ACTN|nr:GNAT family N-acetyltransferase [Nocardioides ginsengisegetis]MBA8803850.1 ribosomal protein S18 acetylase RimI-like enzyme [Nocardioides ginsengisegetis]
MSRSLVSLRCALPSDAPQLAVLWSDVIRRVEHDEQVADLVSVIESAAISDTERLVVAEYDGELAGAVYLRITPLSPINLEPTVQAISPHVLPQYRRKGVGRSLMDAAVSYAEENGVGHLATAAASASRDANRFMARLALGPQAVFRVATTHAVRSKLTAQRPALQRTSGRQLTHVLAARRSLRRAQSTSS